MLSSTEPNAATIDFIKAQKLIKVKEMRSALDTMHRQVAETKTRKRRLAIEAHNRATNIAPVNFEVGDFVLVAKVDRKKGSKSQATWQGPKRIVRAASDLVYDVEDLITGRTSTVHASRIKCYDDSSLEVTEELLQTIQHNNPPLQTVEKLLALRYNEDQDRYEVQVQWKGFDYEDPTWEPFLTLQEDIPDLMATFLQDYPDHTLVQKALQHRTL